MTPSLIVLDDAGELPDPNRPRIPGRLVKRCSAPEQVVGDQYPALGELREYGVVIGGIVGLPRVDVHQVKRAVETGNRLERVPDDEFDASRVRARVNMTTRHGGDVPVDLECGDVSVRRQR